ncbi:MAG: FAD-dependent oxidoreductase [Desulfovibrio sp.]|jgi:NADPH-dependent glutamate synthase beta subunit-like oxidoreductase/glutamate synthase domain-containing protein 3/Pyruvate/2-oxoacid:ferredoxin oxidoreductase delta subunit|nr:FAD-dependent oxidoreductase [Desulfovibrio sp.]
MLRIGTVKDHDRTSTQDLLLAIEAAVERGETDFRIEASGQHDIGGPLWNKDGRRLTFTVTNPGQRVGSMCLEGTEILVEGPAPADVGWLNAGGRIVVRGDAGDTAGHCAAAGIIYIGGSAGTRSGSLMKHDPMYDPPQLWILENVGSFSFEFMGGGKAVVCGLGCEEMSSVLGERPCVGMVGGVVYFRGEYAGLPADVRVEPLDKDDVAFLSEGMEDFLKALDRTKVRKLLTVWKQWRKIVPLPYEERGRSQRMSITEFRETQWVKGGIFGDVFNDDLAVNGLVALGDYRLRVPMWENALFAAPCEWNCPASIPSQRRYNMLREGRYEDAYSLVLEYTPFPGSVCGGVCPNPCMQGCTRSGLDVPIQIGSLGSLSLEVQAPEKGKSTGRHVAVIGGGVGGLTAAWHLARLGHEVTVYESAGKMGGKLEQVIPRARLDPAILDKELRRIADMGVHFVTNTTVDAKLFKELRKRHNAVIVATGGHVPRYLPVPGKERIVAGIDFLKAVNRGERPEVPEDVIVIGCGNAGMDAAAGAFAMGARNVVCIDVQRPAAFENEIAHIEAMGGRLAWPVQTREITAEGLVTQDGTLIPGRMVIITIGEAPDLSFLPEGVEKFREWVVPGPDMQILEGVFAVGDTIRPGLMVHAIGTGRKAAMAADAFMRGEPFVWKERQRIPSTRLHTAYFAKCHRRDVPDAVDEFGRCVSCGTCRDCGMCLASCPEKAIDRKELPEGGFEYVSRSDRCIGCGVCAGVCPCGIWTMQPNWDMGG